MARKPNYMNLRNAARAETTLRSSADDVPIGLLADDMTEEQAMFVGSSRVSGRGTSALWSEA